MFTSALFFLAITLTPEQQQILQGKKSPSSAASQVEAAYHATSPSRSLMMINPKERAADYASAFEALRQEKSSARVFFRLADDTKITNVIDMKLMPNSTLVLFRFTTAQGVRFHVTEIEDIVSIENE